MRRCPATVSSCTRSCVPMLCHTGKCRDAVLYSCIKTSWVFGAEAAPLRVGGRGCVCDRQRAREPALRGRGDQLVPLGAEVAAARQRRRRAGPCRSSLFCSHCKRTLLKLASHLVVPWQQISLTLHGRNNEAHTQDCWSCVMCVLLLEVAKEEAWLPHPASCYSAQQG